MAKETSVRAIRIQQAYSITVFTVFVLFFFKIVELYIIYVRNILTEIVIRRHLIKSWRIQIHN